ncbi:LysR family transcriptional regulator [Inquilinus limosus]|uniref:LysR family transcriptional regulator n=1 Tax=Inquilinus limosus TaxID=171674 RepID=A0A211ZLB7_9PROT|nr:LysR family transcriptional regulator [Inquilinus limosus]OWJ65966.1 LysR family transcriptional regulator [Inquilinus limosus]
MKKPFTIERDQLDGVIAVLRVAERRSFRAAAAELGVSPSAISQTIRGLEARLGVALLTRTTRRVGLTEAGQRFLDRARPAVAEILAAFDAAQSLGEAVTGLLRLNMPRALVPFLAEPILAQFGAAHPALQIEIFAEDGLANIVAEGFDAGIRLGELLEADMVAVRLTPPFQFAVVGSPAYFARHGRPQRPEDLHRHACIGTRQSPQGPIYRWEFVEGSRAFDIAVAGPVIVNSGGLNLMAAAMGLGLAYTAAPAAQDQVAAGALEPVLQDFCPGTPGLFLYYPSRAQALPKLRAFIEFVHDTLRPETTAYMGARDGTPKKSVPPVGFRLPGPS